MVIYSRNKTLKFLLLAALVVLFIPAKAQAYIGPGAGFAVVGSLLAIFSATLSAILALFTWPVRYVIRAIRGRRAFARSRIKKFVVLGLDGMDYALTKDFLEKGKLPNLAKLHRGGCFKQLVTTIPAISPVAWSSFQTGSNPGKHNIFDFLTRDKKSYLPKLSSVDIRDTRRKISLGKYQLPLGKASIHLLRKGKPFWTTLGEHGIFSSVIRVPVTFPPEKFYGVQLSGMCVHGICKFLLLSTTPEFELYVTPVNIDPEKPAMPISHPGIFSTYLAKRQGPFATLGLPEDSWALNEKILSDESFIKQSTDVDIERRKMFFDSLDKIKRGLCICVFDGMDRIQHTFWRDIDEQHPAHKQRQQNRPRNAIEELYRRMDDLVGETLDRCKSNDTVLMIISDHGFNSFRCGVDLNRWLEESGYLKLKHDGRNKKNLAGIDWSETRAFALGLAGIFLNLKGREAQGIVDPENEADSLRDEIASKLTSWRHNFNCRGKTRQKVLRNGNRTQIL